MKRFLYLLFGLCLFLGCKENSETAENDQLEQIWQRLHGLATNRQSDLAVSIVDSLLDAHALAPEKADYWKGLIYDLSWQIRPACYHYQRAFESYQDPISDWVGYASSGYREAVMWQNLQDNETAMRLAMQLLNKADSLSAAGSNAFPPGYRSFTYVLIAEIQSSMGMADEAKENILKSYEVLSNDNPDDLPGLLIMCSNHATFFLDRGDIDDAEVWVRRAEHEFERFEQMHPTQADMQDLLLEYRKTLSLLRATILAERGQLREAAIEYTAVTDSNLMRHPHNLEGSISYLLKAKRYDEALDFMARMDTLFPVSSRPRPSLNIIRERYIPRFEAHLKAGHTAQALSSAATLCQVFDSVLTAHRHDETAELIILHKTQEKVLALKQKESAERIHLIIILCLIVFLIISITVHWRVYVAKKRLHKKDIELFDTVQQMMDKNQWNEEKWHEQTDEHLTSSQKIYRQVLELMRTEHPYTDSDLKREDLAQMLGTNYSYLGDAIREHAGMTLGDFLDDFRIRHAARLLAETDDPIGVVTDLSGFNSRSHFNTLFRERYKMTPSEYRRIAKER